MLKKCSRILFENEFVFENFFVCLDSNFLKKISYLNVRVLDLKIIRSRHLLSGFCTEVYESHCEEILKKRHVLEKHKKTLAQASVHIRIIVE
jgi:hypothetical protein